MVIEIMGIRKIFNLLTKRERKNAALLLCMILIMALLDAAGVGSVVPFMTLLGDPKALESNKILGALYQNLGYISHRQFLYHFGLLVFCALVLSLAFKLLTSYMQLRFVHLAELSIGHRLFEIYLNQPYGWYLNQNSSTLSKNILTEVENVIGYGILALLNLMAQSAVVIAMLTLLIYIDVYLALCVGLVLGCSYGLIYLTLRGHLSTIGIERSAANNMRFLVMNEAFDAIKEVKLRGLEQNYSKRFFVPAKTYALSRASQQAVTQMPRYMLEALAFGGMLSLVLYLIKNQEGVESALPIIALYAFAGYRLMPALQQMYASFTQLRFAESALNSIHDGFNNLALTPNNNVGKNINFRKSIDLKNIYYEYPGSGFVAFKNINLSIFFGQTIGIVGPSGSGKTTLVDLISGLVEAQHGSISVDGQTIDAGNLRGWQKTIGYVTQHVHLIDDTISANIALGVEVEKISKDKIEYAAKLANLHNFIENQLEYKYSTIIGEKGVRLSGGQRQRIAIARALYHNPQLLILDEATSSLDGINEEAIVEALKNLQGKMTIIIIAHRLSTIKSCDKIYLIEKGELTAQGTCDELNLESPTFRKLSGKII
jgi:ABC-type multidrug transport system fused ATPase/permease subunit